MSLHLSKSHNILVPCCIIILCGNMLAQALSSPQNNGRGFGVSVICRLILQFQQLIQTTRIKVLLLCLSSVLSLIRIRHFRMKTGVGLSSYDGRPSVRKGAKAVMLTSFLEVSRGEFKGVGWRQEVVGRCNLGLNSLQSMSALNHLMTIVTPYSIE